MDYENKYKNALERAKKLYEKGTITESLNYIFPELKEPNDERIRKALIDFFNAGAYNGEQTNGVYDKDIIAWLEKQGGHKEYTFKSIPRLLDMIEPTNRAKFYCQKLIDSLLQEGYATDAEIVGDCLKQVNDEKVTMTAMDKQEPDDKMKQKFKIGDWIVWQDKCYKVNYNGCGYELVDQNGLSTSLEYETIDENAHLWTINDVKPGDVLASECCDAIILFKGIKDNNIDFYCDYDFSGIDSEVDVTKDRFAINKGDEHYGSVEDAEDFHPATKEQRDTLMQAMTNAGWQFDFEKKELKKII